MNTGQRAIPNFWQSVIRQSSVWQSSRGAGRSRIVVNLDQPTAANAYDNTGRGGYVPPGGSGKRRGGCRRAFGGALVVVLLVIVALLVAGFFFWRSYQSSPVYSLALLADAAQRDDEATFNSLVDAGQVTRSLMPQVRQRATGSARNLPPAVERQVDTAIEQQLPNVEATVRDSLRATIADAARQAGGEIPFPLLVIALRGLASDVQETGDRATLNLNTGGEQPTGLTMQRSGARWQIVGVKDSRIVASLAEELPRALPNATPDNLPDAVQREPQRRLPGAR